MYMVTALRHSMATLQEHVYMCLQMDFNLSLVEYELVNVPPEAS
jgi:hypothetical protein